MASTKQAATKRIAAKRKAAKPKAAATKQAPAKKAAAPTKAAAKKQTAPPKASAKQVAAAPPKASAKQVAAPKKPAAKAKGSKMGPPSAAFSSIAAVLGQNLGIELRKMFGCHGLSAGGHVFVFEHDGELVVRLPPERVTALSGARVGAPFDPGMGKPSKGWLSVRAGGGDWQRLAEEGLAYAGTLPPK